MVEMSQGYSSLWCMGFLGGAQAVDACSVGGARRLSSCGVGSGAHRLQ